MSFYTAVTKWSKQIAIVSNNQENKLIISPGVIILFKCPCAMKRALVSALGRQRERTGFEPPSVCHQTPSLCPPGNQMRTWLKLERKSGGKLLAPPPTCRAGLYKYGANPP